MFMAATSPTQKDFSVIKKGVDRFAIIKELGDPIDAVKKNGLWTDYYNIAYGTTEGKVTRVLAYGAANVFSFGLFDLTGGGKELEEALGKPSHHASIEINYTAEDKVNSAKITTDEGERTVVK
jgi:hypothetical protein